MKDKMPPPIFTVHSNYDSEQSFTYKPDNGSHKYTHPPISGTPKPKKQPELVEEPKEGFLNMGRLLKAVFGRTTI